MVSERELDAVKLLQDYEKLVLEQFLEDGHQKRTKRMIAFLDLTKNALNRELQTPCCELCKLPQGDNAVLSGCNHIFCTTDFFFRLGDVKECPVCSNQKVFKKYTIIEDTKNFTIQNLKKSINQ